MKIFSKIIGLLLLVSFCSSLVGCTCLTPGFVKRRQTEYLRSCETPPLQVPPGLNGNNISDDYVIPPLSTPPPEHPVDITPPCR